MKAEMKQLPRAAAHTQMHNVVNVVTAARKTCTGHVFIITNLRI